MAADDTHDYGSLVSHGITAAYREDHAGTFLTYFPAVPLAIKGFHPVTEG